MLNAGEVLDGKYEVVRILGRGGMGTVYLCRNRRLDNFWAIKEVKREIMNKLDFLAEPNILKQLTHPGIPRIIDIFEERDNLYMVMDYIEGESLESHIRRAGGLDEGEIASISLELCDILEYLHGLKPPIIYRDLKPSNIIITTDGRIKLIDFGISRVYKENQQRDTMVMGSSGYAAPEQYGTAQTNTRSDVYGLGATIYFMAAGEAPPLVVHIEQDKNYRIKIGEKIGKIIEKAMSYRPEDRYDSIVSMKNDIKSLRLGREDRTFFMGGQGDKTLLKTGFIKAGEVKKKGGKSGLKRALIGFLILIVILSAVVFYVLGSSRRDNALEDQIKPPAKVAEEQKPEEKVKDINMTGIIDKDSPVVLSSGMDYSKKKGKDKKEALKSYLYTLNPKAASGVMENSLVFRIESLELFKDSAALYCTIENRTGKDIGMYNEKTRFFDDDGDSSRARSMSLIKESTLNGTKEYKIKIIMDEMELDTGRLNFKTALSIKGSNPEVKDFNLIIDVR